MPRLRLKTKLVLAISTLVVAIVAAFATIYISQIVRQRVDESYNSGNFVAHQIFHSSRELLELDLSSTRVDTNNPQAVLEAAEESLQTDPGLNSLLQSIVGYSPIIYDVAIADSRGRPLLHSDPDFMLLKKSLPSREDFRSVRDGGFRRQIEVVYGAPSVYEIQVPIERNGKPFGSVRV